MSTCRSRFFWIVPVSFFAMIVPVVPVLGGIIGGYQWSSIGPQPSCCFFHYLVSEMTHCGEGPIGSDSNGTLIPNSSPCPLP